MNIRVDLTTPIKNGTEVVFRSPVDCSQVTGLKVYYPEDGVTVSKEFAFADAHGNNVGDIDHLFAENVVVKVILDLITSMAFVQNADTNAYLEGRFADLERQIGTGGSGGGASALIVTVTDGDVDKTSDEILAHIQNGGVAYLHADGYYMPLSAGEYGSAFSGYADEEGFWHIFEVCDDQLYSTIQEYAWQSQIRSINEKMGDIDTALDNIIAIQNSLIGGDA